MFIRNTTGRPSGKEHRALTSFGSFIPVTSVQIASCSGAIYENAESLSLGMIEANLQWASGQGPRNIPSRGICKADTMAMPMHVCLDCFISKVKSKRRTQGYIEVQTCDFYANIK